MGLGSRLLPGAQTDLVELSRWRAAAAAWLAPAQWLPSAQVRGPRYLRRRSQRPSGAGRGPTGLSPASRPPAVVRSFSCDSNRRLFRYMRRATKDCNSSSFVWEGTTAARVGGANRAGGDGCGATLAVRVQRSCGVAGRPASPAPLLVVQPAFPPQCCYANQVTSPPSTRRVAPD